MSAFLDLTNQKYGRLLVLDRAPLVGKVRWRCICECGNESVVTACNLRSGHVSSCGCLQKETASARAIARNTIHGHNTVEKQSPTWQSWRSMISRCTKKSHRSYQDYGDRGIAVCDHWKEFVNFLADMGERPIGKTLDRIDVNGNYEPKNCRWATKSEQQRNRTDTRLNQEIVIEIKTSNATQRELAEKFGVDRSVVSRIKGGKAWLPLSP